jgi:hypothetical protein
MVSDEQARNEEGTPAAAPPARACAHRFRLWLLGTLGVMSAWMVCLYHGGEQSYVRIHDCLDSNIPMYSLFMQSDAYFAGSDAVFQPLLGGVPRNCLPGETSLQLLPYRYLSAFHAFVLCEFLVKAAALMGMALLLRRHLVPNAPNIVVCGAAFCFSLLPFYPCSGLTVAGQPLLLYAVLNLRNRDMRVGNWLIVGLFPFLSSLVTIGFVLIPLLALCVVYEAVKRRKATVPLLAAWLLLTFGYAIAEYRLLLQVFAVKGFVSHRVEFGAGDGQTFVSAVKGAILNFIYGHNHVESAQFPVIMLACAVAIAAWMIDRYRRARWAAPTAAGAVADQRYDAVALVAVCFLCGLISLWYGLVFWSATGRIINATGIGVLRAMHFERVNWLHPFLWGLAFAFALAVIWRKARFGAFLVVLLIAFQAAMAVRAHERQNYDQIIVNGNKAPERRLTFGQFFSAPLFAEIKNYIGRPQDSYCVVSLGMYPSIPLYNGFYTADGYLQNYSLDYKHRFRKVIAGELEKDEDLQTYFDGWASRCYLFAHGLGRQYLYTKKDPIRSVEHLDIDTAALRELGVEYIFSAVDIRDHKSLGLRLERVFERDDSPWQIYLYSIERPRPLDAEQT